MAHAGSDRRGGRGSFGAGMAALAAAGLLAIAAGAVGVEVGGPEMIDTEPPKEAPVEEPPQPVPAGRRGPRAPLGIAVRTGYMLPGSGKDAYAGTFAFGASYTLTPQESRLSYEFGFDAAWSDREDGGYSAALTFLRAAALYRPLASARALYVLGGANLGFESIDGTQPSSNSAGGVDLGLGGRFGPLDARLAYSIYLGSRNSAGALAVSVGYGF